MTYEDRLVISYFKTIATLNAEHRVFLVQHIETGKLYVRKELFVCDPDVLDRLMKARIPGIPQIICMNRERYATIIIEEYIAGDTLEALLASGKDFTVSEIVSIGSELCDTLSHLHHLDPPVIHRDIKPSNIILDRGGHPVLIDMNAAKSANPSQTRDTHLLGSVGYAAPEQFGFGASDQRTDVYAIGVLLREMLSQCSNHNAATKRLKRVIESCVMMDPQDRFDSVESLKKHLSSVHHTDAPTDEYVLPGFMRFFPPGFRTLNPVHMLTAAAIYYFVLSSIPDVDFSFVSVGGIAILEKIIATICFLTVIFFTSDYLQIQHLLRIGRIRNPFLKMLAVFAVDTLICVTFLIIMILVAMPFAN